jgi:DNA-binding response OmpR family regulator
MRVLLVEDEPKICIYIKQGLEEQGYAVDAVQNGREALEWAQAAAYDLIILDIMLPGLDGLMVCRELREGGMHVPILMLTALATVDDRVDGLDAGADDYLVKPFAIKELLARLRALSRRGTDGNRSPYLRIADLEMNTLTHQVKRAGKVIDLAAKEYSVLECLLRDPERVLTRTQIAEHVWNFDIYNHSNVVDVYIRNLRRKIDEGFNLKLIQTVRGTGYSISIKSPNETV